MTTQTQTIIFCIMAAVAVPLGTFTIIKCIKKLTPTPVNTLHSRGDIELTNFIEPTRPPNSFQIDLEDWYERGVSIPNSVNPPSYPGDIIPSYRSGTVPEYHYIDNFSYNSSDRFYINSILENENMIIAFFILICIFLTLYFLIKITNKQIVKFINIKFFILMLLMYLMIINKKSDDFNTMNLIPFSVFNIDFRDSFEWELKHSITKPTISYLKIQNLTIEIQSLLNSLKHDVDYSMSLSFISSYEIWKDNKDKIDPLFVDNAIIINKESDPFLITQFIMDTLNEKDYFITDWLFNDSSINSIDPSILTVIIPIIVKI